MSHESLTAADVLGFQAEQGGGVEGGQAGVFHAAPVDVCAKNREVRSTTHRFTGLFLRP